MTSNIGQLLQSRELLISSQDGEEQVAHIDSTAPFHIISMLLHESLPTVECTVLRETKMNFEKLADIDLSSNPHKQIYELPWKSNELHPKFNDEMVHSGSVLQMAGTNTYIHTQHARTHTHTHTINIYISLSINVENINCVLMLHCVVFT
jgi:hypothetical protein